MDSGQSAGYDETCYSDEKREPRVFQTETKPNDSPSEAIRGKMMLRGYRRMRMNLGDPTNARKKRS